MNYLFINDLSSLEPHQLELNRVYLGLYKEGLRSTVYQKT
jgi:hypothetical protein